MNGSVNEGFDVLRGSRVFGRNLGNRDCSRGLMSIDRLMPIMRRRRHLGCMSRSRNHTRVVGRSFAVLRFGAMK